MTRWFGRLGFALVVALAPGDLAAEAGPSKPPTKPTAKKTRRTKQTRLLMKRIKKALPKRWTLKLNGLPKGVLGMAMGPPSRSARSVVILSQVEETPTELNEEKARGFLESILQQASKTVTVTDVSETGPLGGPVIRAKMKSPELDQIEVRYLFISGKPALLLTVLAPNDEFAKVYDRVMSVARPASAAVKTAKK